MKKIAVLVFFLFSGIALKAQLEVGLKGFFMQSDISLSDLESVNVSLWLAGARQRSQSVGVDPGAGISELGQREDTGACAARGQP